MFIEVQNQNSIATVILNRPEVKNSFHPQMIQELTNFFIKSEKDKNLRAVVIKGNGTVFCAGADLQWMQSMVKFTLQENIKDAEKLYELFASIKNLSVPVVCQVHGAAFGGALGLLAAADFVVAESKTQFCFSEVKLGIAPAVISSFVLEKCIGSLVHPWMLSGAVMNASTALKMGLVNEVVDGMDQVETVINKYTQSLLEAGPEAVRETKKLISKIGSLSVVEQKKLSTQVIAERRVSAEGQEGIRAFLEKRMPSWKKI